MRSLFAVLALALLLPVPAISGGPVEVSAPELPDGFGWTSRRATGPESGLAFAPGWDQRIFWDLRLPAEVGRLVNWKVVSPRDTDLAGAGKQTGVRALCAHDEADGRRVGCRLFDAEAGGPAGPRVLVSSMPGETPGPLETTGGLPSSARLNAGTEYDGRLMAGERLEATVHGRGVAEGVVVTPAGPREVVLLREIFHRSDESRVLYRFLERSGNEAARLEGPLPGLDEEFVPDMVEVLVSREVQADDGLEIRYEKLSGALTAGTTGFLQYSLGGEAPLNDVNAGWTTILDAISIDSTAVGYQPDSGDPGSQTTLPEVWDFTGLDPETLTFRTFNTTRDDLTGNQCAGNCAQRDLGLNPPDGTWQTYLKIDTFDAAGTFHTRSTFELNDNDTGADPSLDVVFVAQDELNTSDWTQLCFEQSAGGGERFLKFFQFTGADPGAATLGVGGTWTSGDWTECDSSNGLKLTAASQCGESCWPGCTIPSPRARGRLGGGAGFRSQIIEDGWVHVAPGNYVPALLMRQDTDLEAGLDFIATCALGTTPNRAFDYFWLNDYYGLLALISSVSDENIPADDWSGVGNVTDGVDVTWGPYPPYQAEAQACLTGTRVSWSLPADGSNLNGEPNVADYGYVVSWGSQNDPEELADYAGNLNRTPLPGEAGYLAAPAGNEPTSTIITTWGGAAINVAVTTALRYTDPDVSDVTTYRSAAFYKLVEDPARLDPGLFQVGNEVAPLADKQGSDIELSWPAVAGAGEYRILVRDLATGAAIPCPLGLDCAPLSPPATHLGGAASGTSFGYRVLAVDSCGTASNN